MVKENEILPLCPSNADGHDTLEIVKTLLRRDFKIGHDVEILDDMPLRGGDYEIDSLDVLLLVISVEKEFDIKIPNAAVGKTAFESVTTLADYINECIANK